MALGKTKYQATIFSLGEIQGYASSALAGWTRDEVQHQIQLGNDEYVIGIDGKVTQSRDLAVLDLVKRNIKIDFVKSAVELAISVMRREFESAIVSFVSNTPKVGFNGVRFGEQTAKDMSRHIRVFWGKGEKGVVTEVTNVDKIENFEFGDWLAITPMTSLVWMANSPMWRGDSSKQIGFLGRTARALRRKMKLSKALSPIRIKAAFSKTIARKMGVTADRDGKNAVLYGQPCIFIRIRKPSGFF